MSSILRRSIGALALALAALAPALVSLPARAAGCSGSCAQVALSAAHVELILRQAVVEASANGEPATLAVVDHLGNVLAVYQMTSAPPLTGIATPSIVPDCSVAIGARLPAPQGLAGVCVPSTLAAISKAGTASYLSTQGNAFSTRSASQIVQQNFNPAERNQPGGPLFGVQFSQLPCGDLVLRFGVDALRGPKRMPLGFSADPGGLPLYLGGVPVGGIGVESNRSYTLDPNPRKKDRSNEERIATAATRGFAAPKDRRADRISVAGKLLRFADDEKTRSRTRTPLPPFASLPGALVAVDGFSAAAITAGGEPLQPGSGIVRDDALLGLPAEILVEADGVTNRYPPASSALPGGLTAAEVEALLREALTIAARARAQIRRPLGDAARVTVSIVDTDGVALGIARSPDAPPFGIDVSLQKARAAAVLSSPSAAADLGAASSASPLLGALPIGDYVSATAAFTQGQLQLDGDVALANRSIGNLARPFFPDGIQGRPNGPLSRPISVWSPFNTGLQLDLVLLQLALTLCPAVQDVQDLLGLASPLACPAPASPPRCTDVGVPGVSASRIPNGIQIFPGSVPIYRGDELVGGIGVSGDGVDQDDMIAFLGLHHAARLLGTLDQAPPALRADRVHANNVQLRYVSCPPSPFRSGTSQNVCEGK